MLKKLGFVMLAAAGCAASTGAGAQLPNPSAESVAQGRNNPCTDPWVSLAVSLVKTRGSHVGRAAGSGNSGECDIKLYNGGRWGSYDELVGHVKASQARLAAQNVRFDLHNNQPSLKLIDAARGINPANLVAAGAGNILGNAAGNLVAAGAGNLVAAGAGNLRLMNVNEFRFAFDLPGGGKLLVR
jgi:hypothetical protein